MGFDTIQRKMPFPLRILQLIQKGITFYIKQPTLKKP